MAWTYCEQWNYVLHKPLTPFDEIEARRRHESGNLYTAVTTDSDGLRILVHVRLENDYVATHFHDKEGRDTLVYNFRVIDGRLFLRKIITYTYDENSTSPHGPLVVETYAFTPEGICRQETDDSRVETIEVVDRHSVDVSTHWENIPEFGEYAAVAKYERE